MATPNSTPTDSTPQGETSFDPYALAPMNDAELLAIVVEALNDYPFLDYIKDAVWEIDDMQEHAVQNAMLHVLREAVQQAAARGEGGE